MSDLTLEERACNYETACHIMRVQELIHDFVSELLVRADVHDHTKLERPEWTALAKAVPLDDLVYGSPAYDASKASLASALAHHYARARHHPEHWKSGVLDMTLVDIVEMFLDWKASSERHNAGNILKSIEANAEKYSLGVTLTRILENTAKEHPC